MGTTRRPSRRRLRRRRVGWSRISTPPRRSSTSRSRRWSKWCNPSSRSCTLDVNGILQVSAEDKGSGSRNQIQIKNEERISSDEIDRMVREAEEMAEADRAVRERVDAKNGFESYVYSVRNTVSGTGEQGAAVAEKLSADDKAAIEEAIAAAQSWMESNLDATKEEFDEQKSTLEQVVQPIFSKLYAGAGGGMPGAGGAGAADADFNEL